MIEESGLAELRLFKVNGTGEFNYFIKQWASII
jgi:hypothetical protein